MLLHRFLLTILPSPALSSEVDRLKALVHERVGSFSGRNTVPHITLFVADLPIEFEQHICEGVARGVVGHEEFLLHYQGITHFPDKRVIYIDPVEKEAIATIRTSIVTSLRGYPAVSDVISATEHPHLTIAAGLKPAQFEKAWELLAPHAFTGEERVTEVVLLRRSLKPGTRYEHVRSFPLG